MLASPLVVAGGAIALEGAVVVGAGALAGSAATLVEAGSTTVYFGYGAAGEVVYVGVTNNFAVRAVAHASRFAMRPIEGLAGIAQSQARGAGQALIENMGRLNQNTGPLLNKINSIAKSNPIYKDAISTGNAILKSLGP